MKPTNPFTSPSRWFKSTAVLLLAGLATLGSVRAAVVLPSVAPGTKYRIVFTTTSGYQSYNPNTPTQTQSVSWWNNIVNTEADLSSSTTVQNANFHVVGSIYNQSTTINGPTQTAMDADSVDIPVYNTRGELVAAKSSDFWSANHVGAMNADRNGTTGTSNVYVAWTPTLSTFRPFGHGNSTWYASNANTTNWSAGSTIGSGSFLKVLAISDPITAVPEPSSALFAGIGLLGILRRRRR